MLNGKPVDALAMIVHRSAAQQIGRAWTKKLRKSILTPMDTRSLVRRRSAKAAFRGGHSSGGRIESRCSRDVVRDAERRHCRSLWWSVALLLRRKAC